MAGPLKRVRSRFSGLLQAILPFDRSDAPAQSRPERQGTSRLQLKARRTPCAWPHCRPLSWCGTHARGGMSFASGRIARYA